jgi:tetratricopeptide (TPR) repeat protein
MHTKLSLLCDKLIEAGWLAAVILVPLWFNIYSARTFEPDKITLMRSIALLMVLAWCIKVAEAGIGRLRNSGSTPAESDAEPTQRSLWRRMLDVPLLLPVLLVVFAYLLSTALSISPSVALWGSYQRMQGTYTALSYIVIFAFVASHLRSRAQLDRLMTTIILTSLPVGLYGIIQRYGLDPLPWAGDVQTRVASSLGNAIFVASYLIMAIPPTLARLLNAMRAILQEEEIGWGNTILAAVYIFILAVDVIAVIFSGSRGPMLGLLAGVFFFVLLGLLLIHRQRSPGEVVTLRAVGSSLIEVVVPLLVGGAAGATAFAVFGPVIRGDVRLDHGALLALGFLGGVGLSGLYIAVRVAVARGAWRLWLNWAALAVVMACILVAINIPASPLHDLRDVPVVGRLAQLFQPGEGTGKVRALIWEGVLNLITLNEPLGIPGQYVDSLHPVRPIVGYGPESMFNAFARVYPADLAHIEARGSSADRSHNETFDFLVMLGFLGFAAYYWFIFSLFYYLLKAVGWVPDRPARWRLIVLLVVGGVVGALVPFVVTGNFSFSAVALPAGMLTMVFVHLVWQAFLDRPGPPESDPVAPVEQPSTAEVTATRPASADEAAHGLAHLGRTGQSLVLIGILAALIAHFVEVHFVFSIAATYVYFWVYAGVVVAWLWGRFRAEHAVGEVQSAVAMVGGGPAAESVGATRNPAHAGRESRRRRRSRTPGSGTPSPEATGRVPHRPLPAEDWETWLGVFGLVVAVILVAMVFNFVTAQFDVARSNFSMLWMFGITWFIGLAIGLGEVSVHARAWQRPIGWGRAALLFGVTSLGYSGFYLLVHRWQLRPRPPVTADALQSVYQGADVINWLFILFYVFLMLLLLLMAAMLAVPLMHRLRTWRVANWWLYPVLVLAVGAAILFKNVDVVRADIVLKQAEQYRGQGLLDAAIALNQWAVDLDSDEDFYYLMLALAYQLQGQDSRISPEQRARSWQIGERIALQARDINPYNPDNTGNLGRWYLTWAQSPGTDAEREARYSKALQYFEWATHLAPQNVVYYNLWAQTLYSLGRYEDAEAVLQRSVAIDPEFDQTQMLLGDTYGALGRPEDAARAHRAAILLAPDSFARDFLAQRVDFYRSYPDQLEQILVAYQTMMAQRPEDPSIPRILGNIYSRLGQREEAVRYYRLAAERGDTDVQTLLAIGSEYQAMEDFNQAVGMYQQVLRIDPNNVEAHINLGYCYWRLGRMDEAVQENRLAIQLAPDDYRGHLNLVLLYRDTGRITEAVEAAQRLPDVAPPSERGKVWTLLGDLYQSAGRPDDAIAAYEQALQVAPDLVQVYSVLGSLYLQQNRPSDALRVFQQLAQVTPDDYVVHQQLALVYRDLGQLDQALSEANLALAKAPAEQRAALEQLIAELQTLSGANQP